MAVINIKTVEKDGPEDTDPKTVKVDTEHVMEIEPSHIKGINK